jgi:DNA-binding CsgD family transcriptional regulator
MGSLGTEELKDVFAISQKIFDFNNVDELRRQTLSLLEPVFKADKANFFLVNKWQPKLDLQGVISSGVDNYYIRDFETHYHKSDPFLRSLFCFDSNVYTTEQIIPFGELERTAYYNEFLKPQSIHSQIVLYLRSGDRLFGVIALFRPRAVPLFGEDDKQIARILIPYLTAALEKTIALHNVSEKDDIIESIAFASGCNGVLILNEAMDVMYINARAEAIFSRMQNKSPAFPEHALLPPALYNEGMSFMGSAQNRGTLPESRQVRISIPDCAAQPVSLRMRIINVTGGRKWLLISTETDEDRSACHQRLKEFGLTRREFQVVDLVCQGLSNGEIADKLCISEYTVENHLRSIYPKMDVRNRTALAHRVTLLS